MRMMIFGNIWKTALMMSSGRGNIIAAGVRGLVVDETGDNMNYYEDNKIIYD